MNVSGTVAVRFTEFSEFRFDPGRDVILHYKRKHPWLEALVVGGLLALFVSAAVWMLDPDWNPGRVRGKGAWVIGLLLLLPAVVRGFLLALLIGSFAEGAYRNTQRMYDRRPDFVIGPSGLADLDPWWPSAIRWDDVIGITRRLTRDTLFNTRQVISLDFRAPAKKPGWISERLWASLPGWLTERHIALMPETLGMTEDEIFRIVERFGGRFPVSDSTY